MEVVKRESSQVMSICYLTGHWKKNDKCNFGLYAEDTEPRGECANEMY